MNFVTKRLFTAENSLINFPFIFLYIFYYRALSRSLSETDEFSICVMCL